MGRRPRDPNDLTYLKRRARYLASKPTDLPPRLTYEEKLQQRVQAVEKWKLEHNVCAGCQKAFPHVVLSFLHPKGLDVERMARRGYGLVTLTKTMLESRLLCPNCKMLRTLGVRR